MRFFMAYKMFWNDSKYSLPEYYFRTNQVELNSNIAIYGMGNVGKSYLKQFL